MSNKVAREFCLLTRLRASPRGVKNVGLHKAKKYTYMHVGKRNDTRETAYLSSLWSSLSLLAIKKEKENTAWFSKEGK